VFISQRTATDSEIQTALETLRDTRERTLSLVAPLTQTQVAYSPGTDRWSIGEVLDHLLLADAANRADIARLIELSKAGKTPIVRRSLRDINISPAFLPRCFLPFVDFPFSIMSTLIPASLRETVIRHRVFSAVAADSMRPRKAREVRALLTDLRNSLNATESLFNTSGHLHYEQMLYQHPMLGTNNVPQLIRLLALHEQRHQDQITDLTIDRRFPD
jgi:hypothetical protein